MSPGGRSRDVKATVGSRCCHSQPVIEEQSAPQSHPTATTSPARPYPGELGTAGTRPQGLSLGVADSEAGCEIPAEGLPGEGRLSHTPQPLTGYTAAYRVDFPALATHGALVPARPAPIPQCSRDRSYSGHR